MGLAAAVSFYAIFAVAPLMVLVIMVTSHLIGYAEAREAAVEWLAGTLSEKDAQGLVNSIRIDRVSKTDWGTLATSGVILLWAVSLIFVRLRAGIRRIFEESVEGWRGALRSTVIGRLTSLLFALGTGILICVALVGASAAVPFSQLLHVDQRLFLEVGTLAFLVLGGVILLAVIPDHRPPFRALGISALSLVVTMGLGRALLSSYLAHSMIATAYGVASAVVVFLIWIYYTGCVFYLSAALCAEMILRPTDNVTEEEAGVPKEEKVAVEK